MPIPMPTGNPIVPYSTPRRLLEIADMYTKQHLFCQGVLDVLTTKTEGHTEFDRMTGTPGCGCEDCQRKAVMAGNVWITDVTMRQAIANLNPAVESA